MAHALLSRTLFTMLAYTSLSTVAVGMGTLHAAAHQVGLQLFWFLSEAPQCLSISAQSLIARERRAPARARAIVHTLFHLAAVFGVVMAAAFGVAVTHAGWLFSGDAVVRSTLTGLALPGAAALLLCSVVMVFDGVSIGMGRFQHLPHCNLAGLLATAALLALATHSGAGLPDTWCCLLGFFGARGTTHLLHHRHDWRHGLFGRGPLKSSVAFAESSA
jgi:Na+-driven multidrug efflux pump